MENSRLIEIKTEIEKMNKFHQVEILKLFKMDSSIILNENKNGVFINLTGVSETKISELENYIKYVSVQEKQLNKIEDMKEHFKTEFYGDNQNLSRTNSKITLDNQLKQDKEKRTKNVKYEPKIRST